ncbi:hypothetical protein V5O48_015748 [Marasmius crinis-equi]|uniref:UBA domain-containing protein n=1 Tax=Marasmius crinis-equi TaxID=585013 RepID=A0ABR3EU17_9AGAR
MSHDRSRRPTRPYTETNHAPYSASTGGTYSHTSHSFPNAGHSYSLVGPVQANNGPSGRTSHPSNQSLPSGYDPSVRHHTLTNTSGVHFREEICGDVFYTGSSVDWASRDTYYQGDNKPGTYAQTSQSFHGHQHQHVDGGSGQGQGAFRHELVRHGNEFHHGAQAGKVTSDVYHLASGVFPNHTTTGAKVTVSTQFTTEHNPVTQKRNKSSAISKEEPQTYAELLDLLVKEGYPRSDAERALHECGNDPDRARKAMKKARKKAARSAKRYD